MPLHESGTITCPHCNIAFHAEVTVAAVGEDADGYWRRAQTKCPSCNRWVIALHAGRRRGQFAGALDLQPPLTHDFIAWPRFASRPPLSSYVPDGLASDYREAAAVLEISPKASAALSRRALQSLLRDHAGATQRDLADQIQHVIEGGDLPSHLRDAIDAIRNIGNFGTHPLKSQRSGEIVDVEPGEAEWNLDVLDGLFDFYFVQPAELRARRSALDAKLQDLGKPPMK